MTRKDVTQPAGVAPQSDATPAAPHRSASESRASAAATRHRLVVISILLIAAALTTMLYVQFGVSGAGAALVGAVAGAILLLAHIQARKSGEIARLKRELARTQGAALPSQHGAASSLAVEPALGAGQQAPEGTAARTVRRRTGLQAPLAPADLPSVDAGAASHAANSANPALKMSADPLRDQWAFRPREPVMPSPQPPPASYGDAVAPAAPSTIEGDLALVQRKIKALADEVNATEAARTGPYDYMPSSSEAAIESSIDALKAAGGAMRERRQSSGPIPSSLADAAASPPSPIFEFAIPATAERIASSSPSSQAPAFPDLPAADRLATPAADVTAPAIAAFDPALDLALRLPDFAAPPAAPSPRVTAIMQAVEAGTMDVLLSPIVGLVDHDVRHFEMRVQLKFEDGVHIDQPETDLIIAGADMLALFDAARLQRAATLARRLEARGKAGSLLSDVCGPSLTNGVFLEAFARVYEERERIAGQLVLTFAQSDCEHFTQSAWQALADMNSFGFRFALDQVQHIDTDFEQLAQCGFAFVKLDAAALLTGMPSRDRFAQAPEVCARLAGAGLTLIADAVDSEATRARLFGFGVLFGQGDLFGGARRISVEAPAGSQSSQAA